MSALPPVGVVGLLAGALLLAVAAPGHLRTPAHTTATMRRHGVLPPPVGRRVAGLLGPVEAVLGVGTIALWLVAPPGVPGTPPAVAATALVLGWGVVTMYAAFAAYLAVALTRAPGAPCACFGGDEPIGAAGVWRAVLLAAAPWPALLRPPEPDGVEARLAAAGAAVLVAGIAWALPALLASLRSTSAGQEDRERSQ